MKMKKAFRETNDNKTPTFPQLSYLSVTLLNLLSKMFLVSRSKRISAYEIIRHPFFKHSKIHDGLFETDSS